MAESVNDGAGKVREGEGVGEEGEDELGGEGGQRQTGRVVKEGRREGRAPAKYW